MHGVDIHEKCKWVLSLQLDPDQRLFDKHVLSRKWNINQRRWGKKASKTVTVPPITPNIAPIPIRILLTVRSNTTNFVLDSTPSSIRFVVDFRYKIEGKIYMIAEPITAPTKLTMKPAFLMTRASAVRVDNRICVVLLLTSSDTSFPVVEGK